MRVKCVAIPSQTGNVPVFPTYSQSVLVFSTSITRDLSFLGADNTAGTIDTRYSFPSARRLRFALVQRTMSHSAANGPLRR